MKMKKWLVLACVAVLAIALAGCPDPNRENIGLLSSPWGKLIETDYIQARNATLSVAPGGVGILVTRTPGQYANSDGIGIDIAGLRTLSGGTPNITVTGIAIDGANMGFQSFSSGGWGNASPDFSIQIPGSVAIEIPDWANDFPFPFLASGEGDFPFTVTGIMVGDEDIRDLLELW